MDHTSEQWTEAHQADSEPDFYGKWKYIESEAPEGFDWYLVTITSGSGRRIVTTAFLGGMDNGGGIWTIDSHYIEEDEIHGWMPLPQPAINK